MRVTWVKFHVEKKNNFNVLDDIKDINDIGLHNVGVLAEIFVEQRD